MENSVNQKYLVPLLRKAMHSFLPSPDEIIMLQGDAAKLPPIASETFPEEIARQAGDEAAKRLRQMFTI